MGLSVLELWIEEANMPYPFDWMPGHGIYGD